MEEPVSIGDELTLEQKIQTLREVKAHLSREIYSLCLFLGLDPEVFDPETYTPDPATSTPVSLPRWQSLSRHCETLTVVKNKLAELGV